MRVFGFGACMIAGYPLAQEAGFLAQFARRLAQEPGGPVTTETLSLPGFSAPRAAPYAASRVATKQPDIVVLQFGSTDSACPPVHPFEPLRFKGKGKAKSLPPAHDPSLRPPRAADRLRWRIASLLGWLWRRRPATEPEVYAQAMVRMLDALEVPGRLIVVLTPFPFALGRSHHWATRLADALRAAVAGREDVLLVDVLALFDGKRLADFVLADGYHLNERGHALLGEHIHACYAAASRQATCSAQMASLSARDNGTFSKAQWLASRVPLASASK